MIKNNCHVIFQSFYEQVRITHNMPLEKEKEQLLETISEVV
jgi:hypothetical protein